MERKILIGIICVFVIGCIVMICIDKPKTAVDNAGTTTDAIVTTADEVTNTSVETTEEIRLSDSCDKVLASGYDAENNYYELVANETEDYTGVDIKMGVIKNNEWIVNLSQDIPFINDEGALTLYNSSIYSESYAKFSYIGNGCFYYDNCIFNSNNMRSFKKEYVDGSWYLLIIGYDNDGFVMYEDIYKDNVYAIDTNTMEKKIIPGEWGHYDSGILPCSDGLFAYVDKYNTSSYDGFYNFKGEKVIDLSQYRIDAKEKEKLIFSNGQCTFDIKNSAGKLYTITIDTKGQVVNQYEK